MELDLLGVNGLTQQEPVSSVPNRDYYPLIYDKRTRMIKAAVIGVGYLGKFHAEKYAKSTAATLAAVVDISKERLAPVARKYKTKALSDYRMLPELGVQCASVVADTGRHFKISSWLLEHGIDVLVEKPMTTSVAEADELIKIAERNSRILQVGHLERFNPAFRVMKEQLTHPWFFEARRISPFVGRGIDVDVVFDLMIHDIDIIAHLVGQPVCKVEAVGIPVLTGSVDIANARITFEGGAIANVTASRAAFKSERTIRIFQPNVYISLDYEKKKLKIYRKTEEKDLLGFPRIAVDEQSVQERDALADEIDSFLECVRSRSKPLVSGEDGKRAIELAEQIEQALKDSFAAWGVNPNDLV